MRRSLVITLAPALVVVLAAAFASCHQTGDPAAGGGPDTGTGMRGTQTADTPHSADAPGAGPSSPTPTDPATRQPTTTQATPSSTASTIPAPTSPPATTSAQPHEPRFVCPEGGLDDVAALQRAVDEGHQPWRLSAEDVAAACTFGLPDASVEPVGPDRYRVTDLATGETTLVELAQPLGPGTIWVVTSRSASG